MFFLETVRGIPFLWEQIRPLLLLFLFFWRLELTLPCSEGEGGKVKRTVVGRKEKKILEFIQPRKGRNSAFCDASWGNQREVERIAKRIRIIWPEILERKRREGHSAKNVFQKNNGNIFLCESVVRFLHA